MAPTRRSLSSPPPERSAAAMLLLVMGYVFALSEKLQTEFKNLCGSSSSSHNSSSSGGGSDAPPASPALEPTRKQHHGEQEPRAPDAAQGEGRQQKPRERHRGGGASNRLEFSLAAFLRKFSAPSSSSSTVSSYRRSARAQKQRQQQQQQKQSHAPGFAASSTASSAAARRGSGAAAWAACRKVRLGSGIPRSAPRMGQPHGRGLLPAAAPSTGRPRRTDKTLCLDLDETLIHARGDVREMGENRFDFMLVLPQQQQRCSRLKGLAGAAGRQQRSPAAEEERRRGAGVGEEGAVTGVDGDKCRRIFVRKRPHLREFLEAAAEMFEVVLFTAAPAEFARAVVEQIDPERRLVDHILSRENCTRLEVDGSSSSSSSSSSSRAFGRGRKGGRSDGERRPTSVVKDLDVVGRPLSKVIMVENSLDAIRYHLENGVHIPSFYGDREDTGLLSTLDALRALAPMADVRDGIIRLSVETQARQEGHTLTLTPDGSISPAS